jgi:hypothetical protein
VTSFDPTSYGPLLAPLLAIDRRRPLGAGQPDRSAAAALNRLTIEDAFPTRIVDREMASCCLAGVWLLHDFLDESHAISQRVDTAEGSFWHAIMHRREGDFSNSKYWYRHVGNHPVFEQLTKQLQMEWSPFTFVDECQAVVRGKSNARERCLDSQQVEWELLFDYCYRNATSA